MKKHTILIVEDEESIRHMLRYAFEMEHYLVLEAADAIAAEKQLQENNYLPDLIVMDWMLPKKSGIEMVKAIRQNVRYQNIPIIMLTAKADEECKVDALQNGADDYVVKPFSPPELLARSKAILRRGPIIGDAGLIKVAGICIDEKNKRVTINDEVLRMGPLEFRLLHFFMTHQNRVYSREQLLNYVWGVDAFIDERTVDVHIRRLRRRLVPSGYHRFVQTVHGSGYRFSEYKDYA